MRKGLYIGSFDCFHNGHLDVLKQALPFFDEILVVIGNNPMKKRRFTIGSSEQYIEKCIHECFNKEDARKIKVDSTDDLAVTYAKNNWCSHIIRGIRNSFDYAYEKSIFVSSQVVDKDINYIYFLTNLPHISSTMINELMERDMIDVLLKDFLPCKFNCLMSQEYYDTVIRPSVWGENDDL